MISPDAFEQQRYVMTPNTPKVWDHAVLNGSIDRLIDLVDHYQDQFYSLPQTLYRKPNQRPEQMMLEDLYQFERRFITGGFGALYHEGGSRKFLSPEVTRRKSALYSAAARELKRTNFRFFPQLYFEARGGDALGGHDLLTGIRYISFLTTYLMACSYNRFIVGIKDGVIWRDITIPVMSQDTGKAPIFFAATYYTSMMEHIGQREAVAVARDLMHPEVMDKVEVPSTQRSVDELLEDAWYRQRYIVPPEGANVLFRNAGDLMAVTLVESRNKILAKVGTTKGDIGVFIDLVSSDGLSSPVPEGRVVTEYRDSAYMKIVAEVYHDLVTAEEISTTRYRRGLTSRSPQNSDSQIDTRAAYIYIPRRVRLGDNNEPRLPYNGPRRPAKAHRVEGFPRRGNMTPRHRAVLEEYERKLDIDLLSKVPDGFTWVRDFNRGGKVDGASVELPKFIKRNIERRFAEKFRKT